MSAVRSRSVRTDRLSIHLHEAGEGTPVVFVHGNLSDAGVWDEQLALLPHRGIAVDLRGFGRTDPAPIDATRGSGDHRDDLVALLDTLGLDAVHLVGHSMGGGIVMDLARRHPGRALTITVVAPVGPYGFGGTKLDGTPCTPDFAGSGGGTANPDLVRLIGERDETDKEPLSPRNVIRTLYFPGAEAVRDEERLLAGFMTTRVGDDFYPGDSTPSPHWPSVAPGPRGVLNAMSPKYFSWHDLPESGCRAPVLWVRGDQDAIVSDTSLVDLGHLGALGYVPEWPGEDAFPAQPMIQQTRNVLERYGDYTEHVMPGAGHFPFTERPDEFAALLDAHVARVPAS
jgi:pimeloyl-ACP methyl ester carboxylesterase